MLRIMNLNKKAMDFVWSKLGNIILIIALLLVLLIGIHFLTGFGNDLWDNLVKILLVG